MEDSLSRFSQRLVWIEIPLEEPSKYLDVVFFFLFFLKKISSTSLVTLRCDDALRLVSSSLQEKKKLQDTAESTTFWQGAPAPKDK